MNKIVNKIAIVHGVFVLSRPIGAGGAFHPPLCFARRLGSSSGSLFVTEHDFLLRLPSHFLLYGPFIQSPHYHDNHLSFTFRHTDTYH